MPISSWQALRASRAIATPARAEGHGHAEPDADTIPAELGDVS